MPATVRLTMACPTKRIIAILKVPLTYITKSTPPPLRKVRWLSGLVTGMTGLVMAWGAMAQDQSPDIDELSRGVVQIRTDSGFGSGSLINMDGVPVVLTNRHVVEGYDAVEIAVLRDLNEPAQPAYRAELLSFSDEYDLALLRIIEDLDGNPVHEVTDMSVPRLRLADHTTDLRRGDEIAILGYPGIGNDELVYTPGIVSSTKYGEHRGERLPAWYRTNAQMSPGNSGGVAINNQGEVIGLPTFVRTEFRTGGRLGSILAIDLVHAVLAEDKLLVSWSEFTPVDATLGPTFGEATLPPGFSPDPHQIEIISGGPVGVSVLGADCIGHAAQAPDYRLRWTDAADHLFIYFAADDPEHDATLVVNTPSGDWLCNDDASEHTLNPGLAIQGPEAGEYDIWVGSYDADSNFSGQLFVSEVPRLYETFTGSTASGGRDSAELDWRLDPHFGTAYLASGFVPDTHIVKVTAGGSVNVNALDLGSECRGYAAHAPDFRLHWSGSAQQLNLYFEADNVGEKTTLIVSLPNGEWRCNDDAHSSTLNPLVEIGQPDTGQYDIWVGTYHEGDFIEGALGITETEPSIQ